VKGVGNSLDFGERIYDPTLGRFFSVDPITKEYPELSPYQFASNTPIQAIDLDGLEAHLAIYTVIDGTDVQLDIICVGRQTTDGSFQLYNDLNMGWEHPSGKGNSISSAQDVLVFERSGIGGFLTIRDNARPLSSLEIQTLRSTTPTFVPLVGSDPKYRMINIAAPSNAEYAFPDNPSLVSMELRGPCIVATYTNKIVPPDRFYDNSGGSMPLGLSTLNIVSNILDAAANMIPSGGELDYADVMLGTDYSSPEIKGAIMSGLTSVYGDKAKISVSVKAAAGGLGTGTAWNAEVGGKNNE